MLVKRAALAVAVCILLTVLPGFATEIWTRTFGGGDNDMAFAALLLPDGGFLVAGEQLFESGSQAGSHLRLLRLDRDAAIVWDRTALDGVQGSGSSMLAVDGGFLVGGTVESSDGDDAELLMLAIDDEGNDLRWSRYGTPLDEHACAIVAAADDGFFLVGNSVDPDDIVANPGAAGYSGFAGRSNIYVVRTDAQGTEVWARRFDSSDNIIASGAAATADGGLLVLAYILRFPTQDDDILLVKIDSAGNEVWSRTWKEGKAEAYSLVPTSDGGFLISGLRSIPDDPERAKPDALLIKVDRDGTEVWSTSYGNPSTVDSAHVVAETGSGTYICAGWQDRDLYVSTDHLLLAAIGGDGALLWEDATPLPVHLTFANILPCPDGTFVVVGSASARPGLPFHIWVGKYAP